MAKLTKAQQVEQIKGLLSQISVVDTDTKALNVQVEFKFTPMAVNIATIKTQVTMKSFSTKYKADELSQMVDQLETRLAEMKHRLGLAQAKQSKPQSKEAEKEAELKRIAEEAENLKKAQEAEQARLKAEAEAKEAQKAAEEAKKAEQEAKPKKQWNIGQFFKNIASMDELKKAYKKFTKWLHPDVSDYENADEAFKALQNQYEKAEKLIAQGKTVEAAEVNVEISEFLKNAINNISHLEDIEIKVKGTWVWVAGVGKKEFDKHAVLKANGFRFGSKALEWYLADETAGTKKRRGHGYSADQISEKFGEIKVKDSFKGSKKALGSKVAESKKGYKKGN